MAGWKIQRGLERNQEGGHNIVQSHWDVVIPPSRLLDDQVEREREPKNETVTDFLSFFSVIQPKNLIEHLQSFLYTSLPLRWKSRWWPLDTLADVIRPYWVLLLADDDPYG